MVDHPPPSPDTGASASSGASAPPPPSPALTGDQFSLLIQALSTNFAASQQATTTQLNALTQTLAQGHAPGSGGYSTKPPTFHGDGVANVDQFLLAFNRHADFFGWSDDKLLRDLPLSLVGPANIWFSSLEPSSYPSFPDLARLLREKFNSPASLWLVRQQLDQRKMGPTESVATYSADIRRQCQQLRIPKAEWVHILLRGLRPDLRSYLVLQQPQTYEEAEQMATLKEAVSLPDTKPPLPDSLAQALTTYLQSNSAAHPPSPKTVSAVSAPFTSERREDEPLTMSSLRSILQAELRKALQAQQPNHQRFDSRGRNFNQQGRPNNAYRNRRMPDGTPICNTCNRRGHTSYNCSNFNNGPRRDPRLPDANRPPPQRRPPQFHQGNM